MNKRRYCQTEQSKTNFNILVVAEDDNMLCLVSNLLRFHGYQCRTATSGSEAIDIIQESETEMVITDLNLSDLDGRQLHNYIKRLCPDTEVIILDPATKNYNYLELNAA